MSSPRVAHVITRLIVGGAQENTLASVVGHRRRGRYLADLLVGPTYGPEGTLEDEAAAAGVAIDRVPALLRETNPVADPVALADLTRRFRRRRYDVVHTHSSKAGILGRMAARLARVPVVVHTAHGWGFHPGQRPAVRRMYTQVERACADLAHALVVVTPRDRDKALALGIGRPEQYVVIRSGIDVARYAHPERDRHRVRDELGVPRDALVVGSVMRFSHQKAPDILVDAAERVLGEVPGAWFVLVGDGPLHGEMAARVSRFRPPGRVILTGLRRDIPELLGAFDVFALSSRWEGLPRVLPQAMAAGLPIVATAIDGTAEAVAEGESGYLVSPGDPRALADRLRRLLTDPGARTRMGAAGRARVAEFDVETMVDRIEALYDRLLAQRGVAVLR